MNRTLATALLLAGAFRGPAGRLLVHSLRQPDRHDRRGRGAGGDRRAAAAAVHPQAAADRPDDEGVPQGAAAAVADRANRAGNRLGRFRRRAVHR
ncbi:hypothetical protein G6F66_014922 [Rhizopus arrhizus]|nr:hypothetical protein G6F66_014922 [Rhizopus arrhizus]